MAGNDELVQLMEEAPVQADAQDSLSETDIEMELRRVELDIRKEELEGKRQDREQRGKFSKWIFGFMGVYMVAVLAVLVLSGLGVFSLSNTAIVALLTTTTADAIGIFLVVVKYLFYHG